MKKLNVKRLHQDAKLPTYATDGSGCFDMYALEDAHVSGAHTFKLGLAFEIPDDHVMLMFSRSGHGYKNDVRLSNCVGVIDSDYRGEVSAKLRADGDGELFVKKGDRICQACIVHVDRYDMVEVDELSETTRGAGGYGSTGR